MALRAPKVSLEWGPNADLLGHAVKLCRTLKQLQGKFDAKAILCRFYDSESLGHEQMHPGAGKQALGGYARQFLDAQIMSCGRNYRAEVARTNAIRSE